MVDLPLKKLGSFSGNGNVRFGQQHLSFEQVVLTSAHILPMQPASADSTCTRTYARHRRQT